MSLSRRGFTLIELLVAITIIGILSGVVLGAMWRADAAAKEINSKTTVAKVSSQVAEIWESYRQRKLPVVPKLILQSQGNAPFQYQFPSAVNWLKYYSQVRATASLATIYPDPLAPPANSGINLNNNLQIAAIRLAATHELVRLEMPCRFLDFTSSPSGTTPSNASPVRALLISQPMNSSGTPLANPGGLSEQYRQFFMAHANTYNDAYQPAECLYMIIKFASQNEFGQKNLTDDPRLVGDVDGDGMPEIQDAFSAGEFTPPPAGSPYKQHHKPISFVRWPLGFTSDLQPGPTTSQTAFEYAAARHEVIDSLRVDPRAFTLTPLVYSGGMDRDYGIWELSDYQQLPAADQPWVALIQNDPYYSNAPTFPAMGSAMAPGTAWPGGLAGTGSYADNLTNHAPLTGR